MSWAEPPEWAKHAACAGRPDLFFPAGQGHEEARQRVAADRARVTDAKRICAGCPVINECLAHGVTHRDHWASVKGGETTLALRDIAAAMRLAMRGDVLCELGMKLRRQVVAVTVGLAVPDHAFADPNTCDIVIDSFGRGG